METIDIAGLIDYRPGICYPVKNLYHLTDGTTQQADGWIIVWDILHDGTIHEGDDKDKKEEASIFLVTAGVPDEKNPKRIIPTGRPYRASYWYSTWTITSAWTARSAFDKRDVTYYETSDPASNSAEILQQSYLRDIEAADEWEHNLPATQHRLDTIRAQADRLTAQRDRLILAALDAGESPTRLAEKYGVARSAIYQMKLRAQARDE